MCKCCIREACHAHKCGQVEKHRANLTSEVTKRFEQLFCSVCMSTGHHNLSLTKEVICFGQRVGLPCLYFRCPEHFQGLSSDSPIGYQLPRFLPSCSEILDLAQHPKAERGSSHSFGWLLCMVLRTCPPATYRGVFGPPAQNRKHFP